MRNVWIKWGGGDCPVELGTLIEVRHRDGDFFREPAGKHFSANWDHENYGSDITAYREVKETPNVETAKSNSRKMPAAPALEADSAIDLLGNAASIMRQRAKDYDKPEGERAMRATVSAFNTVTGRDLSEADGWLMMAILKMVRGSATPAAHRDSCEDLIAYAALYGEARLKEVV